MVVADMFQPVDDFAVEPFLNGDVGYGGGRCRAMPVFFAGRKPDDVARPNFLDGSAQALSPTTAGGNDESLTERMGMPSGTGARFEGDAGTRNKSGIGRLKERIDPHRAGEPVGRTFCGWL